MKEKEKNHQLKNSLNILPKIKTQNLHQTSMEKNSNFNSIDIEIKNEITTTTVKDNNSVL